MSPRSYTPAEPIWCAGCGHFAVQQSVELALDGLGIPRHESLVLAGIGCSGTIQNNLGTYGYHALHGRVLPTAIGAALSRPDLTVIAAGGDGDGYAIGAGHLVHAFRRDVPLVYLLMNNQTYGLTKGQRSPTRATPFGPPPLDGVALGLAIAGSSFVARGYSGAFRQLTELVTAALRHVRDHRGFGFLEIVSPCVTYEDSYPEWAGRIRDVTDLPGHDPRNRVAAFALVSDLASEGVVPTGVIFRQTRERTAARRAPAAEAIDAPDLPIRYERLLDRYVVTAAPAVTD